MEELKKIICNYVDVDSSVITDEMSLNAELGLDSFSLISMLCEIEETFECQIPDSELPNFQTLHDLYAYVSTNGSAE